MQLFHAMIFAVVSLCALVLIVLATDALMPDLRSAPSSAALVHNLREVRQRCMAQPQDASPFARFCRGKFVAERSGYFLRVPSDISLTTSEISASDYPLRSYLQIADSTEKIFGATGETNADRVEAYVGLECAIRDARRRDLADFRNLKWRAHTDIRCAQVNHPSDRGLAYFLGASGAADGAF